MSLYFPTPAETSTRMIFPGVTIHACAAEKMMLSFVELEPHSVVEEHSHPHEQVGMLLEGRACGFFIGGEQKSWSPKGDISGGFRATSSTASWRSTSRSRRSISFCPIREDYL